MIRSIILVGMFAASTSWAQTTASPQPSDPAVEAQSDQAATPRQGGAANLCQEILAFMKEPSPEAAAPTDAEPASADEETGSAQEITGQEGVATDAPETGEGNAASGSVSNAPQKESRAAPVPPADETSTPKDAVSTVEAVEQLAAANDIAQCQEIAREMRVAGVAMPAPLIALTALDLQYHQTPDAAAEPSGTADPAENE